MKGPALGAALLLTLSAPAGANERAAPFGRARVALSQRGVVVAATPEAAGTGAAILGAGGNAVDAAVATAFALAVTYPQAGNLAGGGFAVVRTADTLLRLFVDGHNVAVGGRVRLRIEGECEVLD